MHYFIIYLLSVQDTNGNIRWIYPQVHHNNHECVGLGLGGGVAPSLHNFLTHISRP